MPGESLDAIRFPDTDIALVEETGFDQSLGAYTHADKWSLIVRPGSLAMAMRMSSFAGPQNLALCRMVTFAHAIMTSRHATTGNRMGFRADECMERPGRVLRELVLPSARKPERKDFPLRINAQGLVLC
jgi:hypothetical protein